MSPELSIIALNFTIIVVAYFSIYPRLAGSNFNKISVYDVLASAFALGVVGWQYWGNQYAFNLLIGEVNWFWFTLITYGVIELPILFWYFKKHKVKL